MMQAIDVTYYCNSSSRRRRRRRPRRSRTEIGLRAGQFLGEEQLG